MLLVVSTSSSLYYLDTTKANMSLSLIVKNSLCKWSQYKPCINSIYARTQDDIYFTDSYLYILQRVYLPDNTSDIDISFPPFPINMTDANETMKTLYGEVMKDIFGKLNNSVNISKNQTFVDDTTWKTHMQVLIPQRVFDANHTPHELNITNYTSALQQVRAYYDKTNQNKYIDLNILPFCNYT